jgi:ribonucleoside-diphosphate reductase alpha chain
LKEDIFNHYEQLSGKTDEQLNIVLDKFIHNFNISVVATDDFMKKVEKDEEYDLVFNGKVYDTVKAKDIFKMIVENAWKNGDPGLIFYDTANNGPYKYSKQEITATNPCGEQQLPSWGSCNLGSIDVSKFYDDKKKDVNWAELKEAIGICIQFLDNVIDANAFPTWRFESWALDNRPVGLGIMGLADLLLKLGLAYGSEESLKFADKLASFFEKEAHKKSVELGKSRGTPKNCRFDELEHRRNITTISIAPTGSISMLASCSSSIEPIYSPETYRYDNTGASLVVHPDADKKHFRCAVDKTGKFTEVSWEEHVKMQAVFQKHCDSGVSKTVNLRNSATLEEVYNAYMLAWKRKCKGITVYRDGSKTTQVLNTSKKTKIGFNNALPRPDELPCNIHNVTADGFEWHIMIGLLDDTPYEVFAVNGKTSLPPQGVIKKKKKRHYSLLDNDGNVLIDNIALAENKINPKIDLETRRFSMELRHGIHPKFIVKQIDKANCVITSFEKAIGRIFKTKYIDAFELLNEPCPSCLEAGRGNGKLSYQSGCKICEICQYSACG